MKTLAGLFVLFAIYVAYRRYRNGGMGNVLITGGKLGGVLGGGTSGRDFYGDLPHAPALGYVDPGFKIPTGGIREPVDTSAAGFGD
jgi:hypothetical protein